MHHNLLVGSAMAATVAFTDVFDFTFFALGGNIMAVINLIAAGASGRRAVANGSDKACPGRNASSPAILLPHFPFIEIYSITNSE